MQDFISFIVKHLVDHPDAVRVERLVQDDNRDVYRLHVGDGDLGQVIGKDGKTARSLRTLVFAAAARLGHRAGFEIFDPARPDERPRSTHSADETA
jgi:hypothetical protein